MAFKKKKLKEAIVRCAKSIHGLTIAPIYFLSEALQFCSLQLTVSFALKVYLAALPLSNCVVLNQSCLMIFARGATFNIRH